MATLEGKAKKVIQENREQGSSASRIEGLWNEGIAESWETWIDGACMQMAERAMEELSIVGIPPLECPMPTPPSTPEKENTSPLCITRMSSPRNLYVDEQKRFYAYLDETLPQHYGEMPIKNIETIDSFTPIMQQPGGQQLMVGGKLYYARHV